MPVKRTAHKWGRNHLVQNKGIANPEINSAAKIDF